MTCLAMHGQAVTIISLQDTPGRTGRPRWGGPYEPHHRGLGCGAGLSPWTAAQRVPGERAQRRRSSGTATAAAAAAASSTPMTPRIRPGGRMVVRTVAKAYEAASAIAMSAARELNTRARAAAGASSWCSVSVGTKKKMLNAPETPLRTAAGQNGSATMALIAVLPFWPAAVLN